MLCLFRLGAFGQGLAHNLGAGAQSHRKDLASSNRMAMVSAGHLRFLGCYGSCV